MEVTRETEAVMLLNVSFGKSEAAKVKPLTPVEWGQFAGWLKDQALGPGDLLNCNLADVLEQWEHPKLTVGRVQALLDRGAALGFALEKWQRAGLWVVTRSDADYPRRLKQRLQRAAPAILFGCGNKELLGASSIAVVGSRHACEADLDFAARIGRRAAECGELVVSGGAAGVDHAAMFGSLHAEGTAVGVLAENLLRAATSTKYRQHLMSGDLALVSPFNPEARFVVGNAMARNKYVYCLAHDAIVVSSTPGRGGTWNGAMENLKKGWVPLSVKRTEAEDSGNPKPGRTRRALAARARRSGVRCECSERRVRLYVKPTLRYGQGVVARRASRIAYGGGGRQGSGWLPTSGRGADDYAEPRNRKGHCRRNR